MHPAILSVTGILVAICTISALLKLRSNEQVVHSVHGVVGVPIEWFRGLAMAELTGAAGLLVGLWSPLVGAGSALALSCYFLCALLAHVRVQDIAGLRAPLPPLALSIAVLVLQMLRL